MDVEVEEEEELVVSFGRDREESAAVRIFVWEGSDPPGYILRREATYVNAGAKRESGDLGLG